MSQFSDLVAEVYTITNRPDLVAETALAVRQATLAAHRSDYYPADRTELLVPFTATSQPVIDVPSVLPNFRAFAYIRPYDVLTSTPAPFLVTFLAPDAIFDEYMVEKVNVAYLAGTNLNVKLQADYTGLLIGYYLNPVLSPEASYSSWIGTQHPAVIVLDAAARVLMAIGYEDAAARVLRLAQMELALFKSSNLEEFGR